MPALCQNFPTYAHLFSPTPNCFFTLTFLEPDGRGGALPPPDEHLHHRVSLLGARREGHMAIMRCLDLWWRGVKRWRWWGGRDRRDEDEGVKRRTWRLGWWCDEDENVETGTNILNNKEILTQRCGREWGSNDHENLEMRTVRRQGLSPEDQNGHFEDKKDMRVRKGELK